MRELLSYSAYERTVQQPALRTALVVAALWAVPMTGFLVVIQGPEIGLVPSLATGLVAGLLFGFGWTFWFRRSMRRMARRIYEGDPKLVPAPPAGPFNARMPCNLMLSSRMAVGGHLYVGREHSTFVPHTRNLPKHRAPRTLSPTPGGDVEVQEMDKPLLARVMGQPSGPLRVLRVRIREGSVRLLVPEPDRVVDVLRPYFERPEPPGGTV